MSISSRRVSGQGRRSSRRTRQTAGAERLEPRHLLSVTPGWTYQDASFVDRDGDLVTVHVDGPSNAGVQLILMGGASDNADIRSLRLIHGDATTRLTIGVQRQMVGTAMSPGTTSIGWVRGDASTKALGQMEVHAAAVAQISLPGVDVGGMYFAMDSLGASGGAIATAVVVGSLGEITAPGYTQTFNLMASGDIGSIEATDAWLAGTIMAGGTIGDVTSYGNIFARITARGSIGDVHATAGALVGAIIEAGDDIGDITARPAADWAAIEGTSVTAGGSIGGIMATASRHTAITQSRFQAGGRIAGVMGYSNGLMMGLTTQMPAAIGHTFITAGSIGTVGGWNTMNVGVGLTDVTVQAKTGGIDSIVGGAYGGGIQMTWAIAPGGGVGSIRGTATNGTALAMLSVDAGSIGGIEATVVAGLAIGESTFTARSGDIGATGGIWATNTGTAATDNAISGTSFMATGDIYPVTATAWGGTAIWSSTLTADMDRDNVGAVWAPVVTASGTNRQWSTGMRNVMVSGAAIGGVTANVTSALGGPAIWGSTFKATTDVQSGGHYDDTGTIGDIVVKSKAWAFAGIDAAMFQAGAAGRIGDISVTTAGEKAIIGSKFVATNFHLDQEAFTSRIGTVTVKAGRAGGGNPASAQAAAHLRDAAINESWFLANAGIAGVDVTSVGNGLLNSWVSADYDWQAHAEPITAYMMPYFDEQNVPGILDHLTVTVRGNFGSGIVGSKVWAEHIGTLSVQVDNQPDGATNPGGLPLAAVAGLKVMANSGIDWITIENSQPRGIASVNSTIGSMTPFVAQGAVRGSVFSKQGTGLFWNVALLQPGTAPGTPRVQAVMLPKARLFKTGDTVTVMLKFNGRVAVTGTPAIQALLPGDFKVAQLMYTGGSGSSTLSFSMKVPAGLNGRQGLVFGRHIVLNGGTIKGQQNKADIALEVPTLAAADGSKLRIDSATPQLTRAMVEVAAAPKGMKLITQSFIFDEPVQVTGTPILWADIGGSPVRFTYAKGTGTTMLMFTAMVPMDMAIAGMAYKPLMTTSFGKGAWLADSAGNKVNPGWFSQSWVMLGTNFFPASG